MDSTSPQPTDAPKTSAKQTYYQRNRARCLEKARERYRERNRDKWEQSQARREARAALREAIVQNREANPQRRKGRPPKDPRQVPWSTLKYHIAKLRAELRDE